MVVPEYLSYFLKSDAVYRTVSLNYITGTALKRIILKGIRKIEVDLPDIGEQEQRAQRLSKVDYLCQLRKQQLDKLDELVKARFVEMFGDPSNNPMGWKKQNFEDIALLITDGEHMTPQRTNKGIYLLSARNILNHAIQLDDVDYIDEEEYGRIARRIVPQQGDVLVSCSGSIGRCCVVLIECMIY